MFLCPFEPLIYEIQTFLKIWDPPPRFSKFRICNSDFFDFGAYPPPFSDKFQNFPDFFFWWLPLMFLECTFSAIYRNYLFNISRMYFFFNLSEHVSQFPPMFHESPALVAPLSSLLLPYSDLTDNFNFSWRSDQLQLSVRATEWHYCGPWPHPPTPPQPTANVWKPT